MHPFAAATGSSSGSLPPLSATGRSCRSLPFILVPGMLVKFLCSAASGGRIAGLSLTKLFSFATRMLIKPASGSLLPSLQGLSVHTFVAFARMLACPGTPGCSSGQCLVSVLHPCLNVRWQSGFRVLVRFALLSDFVFQIPLSLRILDVVPTMIDLI